MLNENIKNLRKAKGISQEELAVRLNVVRQTVSKWERGISVPDSGMLISLAEELDTSVSVLLGENIQKPCPDDELNLKSISEKLETINLQLAKRSAMREPHFPLPLHPHFESIRTPHRSPGHFLQHLTHFASYNPCPSCHSQPG